MQQLRNDAKAAGVPVSDIRSAESAEELQGLIAGYANTTRKGNKKVAVKKKTVAKKTATITKRGPGRPKGSTTKTAPRKAATKKTTTRKTTVARKAHTNGRVRNVQSTDGRHILDGVNYSETDGWNPRAGSAPDVILRSLRKHRGNREKVFNDLKSRMWDFVGKKLANGKARSKDSAEAYLRYRIARTDWDFALKTEQHNKATNRVEYGTGGTGAGTFKRAKKSAPKTAPKRRGRPPKAKTAQTTPKRRGRPVGSKNRTTTRKATPAKKSMKRR